MQNVNVNNQDFVLNEIFSAKINEIFQKIDTINENDINYLKMEVEKLASSRDYIKEEIDKIYKPEKAHIPYVRLLLWIAVLSILFFALFISLNHFIDFKISSNSIVISFIGIISTFIVVSNYMQVKIIEDKFNTKQVIIENWIRELSESRNDTNQKLVKVSDRIFENKYEIKSIKYRLDNVYINKNKPT